VSNWLFILIAFRDVAPPTRALASAGAVTSAPVPSADDLEDTEDKQNGTADAMQS
jgi:hypothetical protein